MLEHFAFVGAFLAALVQQEHINFVKQFAAELLSDALLVLLHALLQIDLLRIVLLLGNGFLVLEDFLGLEDLVTEYLFIGLDDVI